MTRVFTKESKNENKERLCIVEKAVLAEDISGIYLHIKEENSENRRITFTPKEIWGRIPEGKDPATELQVIVDIFNGLEKDETGKMTPVENFTYKKIKIAEE